MSSSNKEDDVESRPHANCGAPAENQQTVSEAKRRKGPSPRGCRNFIRNQTASAMPDIVKTFVGKAKEGSVPHFTSLAKVGGFDQRSVAEAPKRRRRSLARQLLDEVERYEANQAAELAAANEATSQIGKQTEIPGSQETSWSK